MVTFDLEPAVCLVLLPVLDELHDLEGVGGGVVQLTHPEHQAALLTLVHALDSVVKLKESGTIEKR